MKLRHIFSRTEMVVRARLSHRRAIRRLPADWEFKLVVEPDYGAFPLWIDGGENDPELPISPSLREDLQEWADEWERSAWADYRRVRALARPESEREQAWHRRGKELADQVQAELGDSYTVRYGCETDDRPVDGTG